MGDHRKPIECRHFPLCQKLKTVVLDIPASFSGLHGIVLQREAESICGNCHSFEPEDMAGAV